MFAGVAVAGDEGVVFEAFVGGVDFVEFVADGGEEVALALAGNPDADFAFVVAVAFGDFGSGSVFGEDDAGFPDEGLLFDPGVHFDDEAGEDAFGHEFVFVAQE